MIYRESEERYQVVAETRDFLVSASQNVHAALRYLPNIEVPYCSGKEAEVLDRAISFIFTDMQSRERYEHALSCYQTTYKRLAALAQWLGQVISSSISRDLNEVTENCRNKASELRNERIKLIRQRIKDLTGQEVPAPTGILNGTFLPRNNSNNHNATQRDLPSSDLLRGSLYIYLMSIPLIYQLIDLINYY